MEKNNNKCKLLRKKIAENVSSYVDLFWKWLTCLSLDQVSTVLISTTLWKFSQFFFCFCFSISGSNELFVAVDKCLSRAIMAQNRLPIPEGFNLLKGQSLDYSKVKFPCVVKPNNTENSLGKSIISKSQSPIRLLSARSASSALRNDF